jgi:hypothetical protein
MGSLPRHVKAQVLEALGDTRIVVVQGARQDGKTTLVREVTARRGGRLATLDDDLTRAAARADPAHSPGMTTSNAPAPAATPRRWPARRVAAERHGWTTTSNASSNATPPTSPASSTLTSCRACSG